MDFLQLMQLLRAVRLVRNSDVMVQALPLDLHALDFKLPFRSSSSSLSLSLSLNLELLGFWNHEISTAEARNCVVLLSANSEMLPRWSRALTQLSRLGSQRGLNHGNDFYAISRQSYAKAAVAPFMADTLEKGLPTEPVVNLDKLFWSKPCSLALPPDSPLRIDEPEYEGIKRVFLKLMLFYSKQSKSIRGANVVYKRVVSQVDKPAMYEVFNLEKNFKTTYALLVLHMWLCLRRLKQEGKEGVEFGQYVYEIYNHDVELRVSKAGVNLLLSKWMKDLEKIFYGNIVAYDAAVLPEARLDDLPNVIWRNVFSDDGSSKPDEAASRTVQAMARYVRREVSCLSLTDKEAMFSGNFMFTPLKIEKAKLEGSR